MNQQSLIDLGQDEFVAAIARITSARDGEPFRVSWRFRDDKLRRKCRRMCKRGLLRCVASCRGADYFAVVAPTGKDKEARK